MPEILAVATADDILPENRGTPVGRLLEYHNLGLGPAGVSRPELLIGMCMDSPNNLRPPPGFAFGCRAARPNRRDNEFRISYAIAVGNVHTIVLIAHTDCGM